MIGKSSELESLLVCRLRNVNFLLSAFWSNDSCLQINAIFQSDVWINIHLCFAKLRIFHFQYVKLNNLFSSVKRNIIGICMTGGDCIKKHVN